MTKGISAKGINEAIGTIIAKLCYKAADDLGENFSDKTGLWRKENTIKMLEKSNEKYDAISITGNEHAHPRLIHHIIEDGSWCDRDEIQNMWAGLLATSCTETGEDESNLVFVNLLRQLSSLEVSILNYSCENSDKNILDGGWIGVGFDSAVSLELNELIDITGEDDLHRIDRELDHLRSLDLIRSGFDPNSTIADITPTPLALQMYVRCQGYIGSPITYFGLDTSQS